MTLPDSPSAGGGTMRLAEGFPQPGREDWAAMAAKVLNRSRPEEQHLDGAAAVAELTSELPGGLEIEPIYWPEPGRALGLPGAMPFTRGRGPRDPEQPWDARALHDDPDAARTRAAVLDDLEHGATSVWLHVGEDGIATDDVSAALQDVMVDLAPITVSSLTDQTGAAAALLAFWEAKGADPATVRGGLGHDPIGAAAALGTAPDLAPLADAVRSCTERWTGVRAITVDTRVHHDAGAGDADEVALGLATALEYVRRLHADGIEPAEVFRRIDFRVAATADQFATIAKLRALRRTWARVGEVLEVPEADRGAWVHAVTSWRMQTRTDPWVNILRDTIACFGAAAGGADAITVLPHDVAVGLPTPFARRIARNTQTLLSAESHVAAVADPAGGSAYVETLTDEIARAAWQWFGELDGAGGTAVALADGRIADRLAATRAQRDAALATRELPLTGTSTFPLAGETLLERELRVEVTRDGLPRRRDSEAFEALRERAGSDLTVPVLGLGAVKEHTARVSFVGNLLGVAGIRPELHELLEGPEGVDLSDLEGAPVAIIASSPKGYAAHAEATVAALRTAGVQRVVIAGAPSEAEGTPVDDSVGMGMDVLAFLEDLIDRLGTRQQPAGAR